MNASANLVLIAATGTQFRATLMAMLRLRPRSTSRNSVPHPADTRNTTPAKAKAFNVASYGGLDTQGDDTQVRPSIFFKKSKGAAGRGHGGECVMIGRLTKSSHVGFNEPTTREPTLTKIDSLSL